MGRRGESKREMGGDRGGRDREQERDGWRQRHDRKKSSERWVETEAGERERESKREMGRQGDRGRKKTKRGRERDADKEGKRERNSLVTNSALGFPHLKAGVPLQHVHVDVGVVLLGLLQLVLHRSRRNWGRNSGTSNSRPRHIRG